MIIFSTLTIFFSEVLIETVMKNFLKQFWYHRNK